MQFAVSEQVISEGAAAEIHRICLGANSESVPMPSHLNTACERILRWELETSPTVH